MIILPKTSDQDLPFGRSKTFVDKLEVGILALGIWSFSAKLQITPFYSIIVDVRIKPKSAFFSDGSNPNF